MDLILIDADNVPFSLAAAAACSIDSRSHVVIAGRAAALTAWRGCCIATRARFIDVAPVENAADMALAIAFGMELVQHGLERLHLFTGDADFLQLIESARGAGLSVTVYLPALHNGKLAEAADDSVRLAERADAALVACVRRLATEHARLDLATLGQRIKAEAIPVQGRLADALRRLKFVVCNGHLRLRA